MDNRDNALEFGSLELLPFQGLIQDYLKFEEFQQTWQLSILNQIWVEKILKVSPKRKKK